MVSASSQDDEEAIAAAFLCEIDYEKAASSTVDRLDDPFQFFTEWHSQTDDEAFKDLS